jgi:2'-5' RNA ligase
VAVAPLVVTLLLGDEAQRRFDRLRAAHFPPARNFLQAHVTLFHALPGEHEDAVRADLAAAARRPPFRVQLTGVRFLGRGVAYELSSPEVDELRGSLARAWAPWLTPQDRRRHRPHVTVQNKVAPDAARALHARLAAAFEPESVAALGLGLWRYLGGPWEPLAELPFD